MKQFLTVFIFSFLTATFAQADLTSMKIYQLCKNEEVKEACRYVALQNEINEARSDCKATLIMPGKKKAACAKLEELEKEFAINLIKLKCGQGVLSGEDCEE